MGPALSSKLQSQPNFLPVFLELELVNRKGQQKDPCSSNREIPHIAPHLLGVSPCEHTSGHRQFTIS